MYEVRPEGTFLRVDCDTSLARAISKAEQIAALNGRRYVVVQIVSVHVAEPSAEPMYIQRYGRANRAVSGKPKVLDLEGTKTGRLRLDDWHRRMTLQSQLGFDRPVFAKDIK